MPDQPSGENQTNERRVIFGERVAAIEKIVEITLHGRGGVLERLQHLDDCQDEMKKQIAEAIGGVRTAIWMVGTFLAAIVIVANWYFKGR